MEPAGLKLIYNRSQKIYKDNEQFLTNKNEIKRNSSKSLKRLNKLNATQRKCQEKLRTITRNNQKSQKFQLIRQKQMDSDYGVIPSNNCFQDKDHSYENALKISMGEYGQAQHIDRYEIQKPKDGQLIKISQDTGNRTKFSNQHKIRLPENRGMINDEGKFVTFSKEKSIKKLKNLSFQNSNSSKHSFSATNIISIGKKLKKNKLDKQKNRQKIKEKAFQIVNFKCKSADNVNKKVKKSNKLSKEKIKDHKDKLNKQRQSKNLFNRTMDQSKVYSVNSEIDSQKIEAEDGIRLGNNAMIAQIKYQIQKQNQLHNKTQFKNKIPLSRADSINFLSQLCGLMKAKSEVFALSIQILDEYSLATKNLKNIKQKVFSCFTLALKIDNPEQITKFCKLFQQNPLKTVKKSSLKNKFQQIAEKDQSSQKIIFLINQWHQNIRLDEIFAFQIQILQKINFKLSKKTISSWIDSLTYLWDLYITKQTFENHQYLLFRNEKDLLNMSILVQIIEAQTLFCPSYNFTKPIIVLTGIYLISRIRMQSIKETSSLETLFQAYRASLTKSSNLIFCDNSCFNQFFGDFLQLMGLGMANIMECTQQTSKFLIFQMFKVTFSEKLYIHSHNDVLYPRVRWFQ